MCVFQKTKIRFFNLLSGKSYLPSSRYFFQKGYTLVEVTVAMIIICILVSIAAPIYSKAIEQARLDSAAGNLKTVWSAQRAYWLKNHNFADSLATLEAEGLINSYLVSPPSNAMYLYTINSASAIAFSATASRNGSGVRSGEIQIDESGELTGSISKSGGGTLSPLTLE
jgi:prepilin-type N-terminal cleavage/methylation domain-containing protein